MIFDSRNIESDVLLDRFDVCIVGSGAAGLTAAMEFRHSGAKVCLLESGGFEYDDATQNLYNGRQPNPAYDDLEISRLRYFGGTTNHWGGSCHPLDPIDFERRDWVKHSGWPFGRDQLDPYYARAQAYCDLLEFNYDAEYWRRKFGFKRLPLDKKVVESTIFQNSAPTRFGEKYRTDIIKSENISAYLHANVTNIQLDQSGQRVERLDVQVLGGGRFRISARYYVVALGGIENARILLLSNGIQKNGIGNTNGLVGKYFMDHPVAKGAIFVPAAGYREIERYMVPAHRRTLASIALQLNRSVLEKNALLNIKFPIIPVTKYYASEGIESYHALSRALDGDKLHGDLWTHIGNLASEFDMVLEGISRRQFGKSLFDSAKEGGYYLFDAMMETPPEPENRIELSDERDALGLRRVILHYRVTNRVKENFWRVLRMVASEFGRAGVGRVRLLENQGPRLWRDIINFGSHHMGTTRAHVDPKQGVVDSELRVHGVSNLYMAGSSVFPTGGHVPPTLTIVALAIRLSRHLKKRIGV